MPTWDDITANPAYQSLSDAGKEVARQRFEAKYPDQAKSDAANTGAAKFQPLTPPDAKAAVFAPLKGAGGDANSPYDPNNSTADDLLYLKDKGIHGIADMARLVKTISENTAPGQAPGVGLGMGIAQALTPKPKTLSDLIAPGASNQPPPKDLGDKAIDAAEAAVTDSTRKPSGDVVEALGKGAEFVAPNLIPGVGGVLKAAGTAKKVIAGLKLAGVTGLEAAGAGGGGELAKEVGAPEAVGQIVGGLAGGVLTPSVLAKYPDTLRMMLNPEKRAEFLADKTGAMRDYAENAAKQRIAGHIQDTAPEAEEGLQKSADLSAKIPGYQQNLGQATGSAGIIADQQQAISGSSKAFEEARRAEVTNAEALRNYLTTGKEAGVRDPKAYIDQVVKDQDAVVSEVESNAQALRDRARNRATALQSDTQPAEAGAAIRGEFSDKVKANLDRERQAMYARAGDAAKEEGATYSLQPTMDVMQNAIKNPHFQFNPEDAPALSKAMQSIAAKAQAKAAEDAKGGASGLLDASGKPFASAADANTEALLGGKSYDDMSALLRSAREDKRALNASPTLTTSQKMVKGQVLDSVIDDVNNQLTRNPDFPKTAEAHLAADQWFRDKYAPRVKQGPTAKLLQDDSTGTPKILDQDVLGKYTSTSEGARQFVKTFGKGSDAGNLVAEHMRQKYYDDVLKKFVDDEGAVTLRPKDMPAEARVAGDKSERALSAAHDKWMRRNGAVIDELDKGGLNLRSSLGTTHDSIASIGKEQFHMTMMRNQIDNDSLGKLLRTNADQIHVITDTALKDPAAMGRLTAKLASISPQANKSLARSVMNDLTDKVRVAPGDIGVDPSKMGKMLDNNRESLQTLFKAAYGHTEGMRQYRRIEEVYDALQMQARALPKQALQKTTVGQDPLAAKAGFSVRTLFNMVRGVMGGRTSKADAIVALGGQATAHQLTQIYNKVQQEILADPEKTKELLQLVKMENRGASASDRYKQGAKILSKTGMLLAKGVNYYVGSKYIPGLMKGYGPAVGVKIGEMATGQQQQ